MANANYPLGLVVQNVDARWRLVNVTRFYIDKARRHPRIYRTWRNESTGRLRMMSPGGQRAFFGARRET
jgi:hypothetical protein